MSEEEEKPKVVQDPREPEQTGTDYTKPTSKRKRPSTTDDAVPEKKIKKVVSGTVKVEKRGIGSKIKDLFVAADFRSVMGYVIYDIMIPAARNMIVEGAARGAERLIYGESHGRRRAFGPGERSRITYNSPINRDNREPRMRQPERGPYPRQQRNDYIFESRQDADEVLDSMYNILGVFDSVSVGDVNEMVGFPTNHADQKWGWQDLRGVEVRQIRDGWMIDLPPPESL